MDTGLGQCFLRFSQGKSRKSLITVERRAIFEEAAGVLNIRPPQETEKNELAQTQDNLDRLEDII